MTSMHVNQLAQEESLPTVPAHMLGGPTVAATRGNIREDTNLDGNSRETKATHGSLTRRLADLAKSMFTHQEPYRDSEGSDPLDPHTLGDPPGSNLATSGRLTQHLATQRTITRAQARLLMTCQGPTEAAQDLPHSKEDLPILPMLEGYHAWITFGITKEVTASSQDPDQTSEGPRSISRRLTRSCQGVTMEFYYLPYARRLLAIFSRYADLAAFLPRLTHISPLPFLPHLLAVTMFSPPHFHHPTTSPPTFHLTNTYHFYHHLITSLHHILPPSIFHIRPHPIYFTKSITSIITPTATTSPTPHFPYLWILIKLHDQLQRLLFSFKAPPFRSTN